MLPCCVVFEVLLFIPGCFLLVGGRFFSWPRGASGDAPLRATGLALMLPLLLVLGYLSLAELHALPRTQHEEYPILLLIFVNFGVGLTVAGLLAVSLVTGTPAERQPRRYEGAVTVSGWGGEEPIQDALPADDPSGTPAAPPARRPAVAPKPAVRLWGDPAAALSPYRVPLAVGALVILLPASVFWGMLAKGKYDAAEARRERNRQQRLAPPFAAVPPDPVPVPVEVGPALAEVWEAQCVALGRPEVRTLAYGESGKSLIVIGPDALHRVNVATGLATPAVLFPEPLEVPNNGSLSGDGRRLVTSGDVTVWELEPAPRRVSRLSAAEGVVSLDGNFVATVSRRREVAVHEATTFQPTARYSSEDQVMAMALAPGGRTLALRTIREVVHCVDLTMGKADLLDGGPGVVTCLAFSADGLRLCIARGEKVVVRDTRRFGEGLDLKGQRGHVFCAAFSPDGKYLVTGGSPRSPRGPCPLHLWDVGTGELVAELRWPDTGEWVTVVAFSPDGKGIAAVTGNRMVRLWDVTPLLPPAPPGPQE